MMSKYLTSINMRISGCIVSAILCIFLPLILGAPTTDESLKQQIATGLLRGGDDYPYWSALNQELYPGDEGLLQHNAQFSVRTRGGGLDSLGKGNILRSLDGMGTDWSDVKSNNWRFGNLGTPKRGGGLDSLGRGNILRRVNYDDEISTILHSLAAGKNNQYYRSLDSLGKGNILKRSIRSPKLYEGYPLRRSWGPQLLFQKRFDSLSGATFGLQKKNFDEIDRSGFGSFVKRNFDEIDRTGLGFAKRNFDEIDRTGLGFHKKRNFDEIDRTGFGSFV